MILPYLWTKDFTSSLMAHNQSLSLSNTVGFNFKIIHKISTFLTFSDSTFFFFFGPCQHHLSAIHIIVLETFSQPLSSSTSYFAFLGLYDWGDWVITLDAALSNLWWTGPDLHSEQEPILFLLIFPLHIEFHPLFFLTYFRLLILILHALLWGHCFLSDQLSLYKQLSYPLALFYWLSMWLAAILSSDQRLDTTFAMNTSLHSHKQY